MTFQPVNSYFAKNKELFNWRGDQDNGFIAPWLPRALQHDQWPPNYDAVYAWRLKRVQQLRSDPDALKSAKAYYAMPEHTAEFIMHWMDTYDPRRQGSKWVPFVFFIRQEEFITFLEECVRDGENGLAEKCRDAGATWLCCGYSVKSWLFIEDDAVGWGSRKQELVDKIGDASSIFEKMRLIVRRLPNVWKPKGLKEREHLTFMKMINPENRSVITGETGDNIGRGGRTRIYFKDESAHYPHPEKIEAALGDNTNTQIDISSVNGLGNVFHRKRESGIDWAPGAYNLQPGYTRVFVIDWTHHPEKTQDWFNQRKAKAEREGMQHVFAQEVERNYSAAISNTIIPYEWIRVSVDAHKRIRWKDDRGNIHTGIPDSIIGNRRVAGLDVADEGIDRNALGIRRGIVWEEIEEWGERDPGMTARRVVQRLMLFNDVQCQYDSIGIGSAVKSEYNRLVDEKTIDPRRLPFVGWNAGAAVINPWFHVIPDDDQSPFNRDFFHNYKAQAWWSLRSRFYKTWNNLTNGVIYPIEELISLAGYMRLLQQLMKELAQPTSGPGASLRMVVEKKPDGTKSPNLADAGVMMYFPMPDASHTLLGTYGISNASL